MVLRKRTGVDTAAGERVDESPTSIAEQDSRRGATDDPLGAPAAAQARFAAGEHAFEAEPARSGSEPSSMIPVRATRPAIESFFVRLIATGGIIGIGTATAAIMATQRSHGWLIGVVVSVVSVVLAAVLWSSRRL